MGTSIILPSTVSLGKRLVIGGDQHGARGRPQRGRAEFLVGIGTWLEWDDRGANEAEAARAADRLPETVEVGKLGDVSMNPNGMIPAARAAKTATCFGMNSPFASGNC